MGGPFVSYTFTPPANSDIITVEGFVYAPRFDKRNYVRHLEAILSSINFWGNYYLFLHILVKLVLGRGDWESVTILLSPDYQGT